jgi:hypothetical protein
MAYGDNHVRNINRPIRVIRQSDVDMPDAIAVDFTLEAREALADAIAASGSEGGDASAANQVAEQVLIGALTEAAPGTDTASSGLNGRLQRIAQRITSLIALLPGSLGQKTMAASLAVTMASDQSALNAETKQYTAPASGELQGSATVLQLPNVACKLVRFKASYDNVGRVYLGVSGATVANGTTDTTTGLQLSAGDDTGWIPVDNLNRFYRICDNAGDDLTYLALA